MGGSIAICYVNDPGFNPPLVAAPMPADVALCKGFVEQASKCAPLCLNYTADCEVSWACTRRLLRQDMIADLYACMPDLPCSEAEFPISACASKLGAKYPPSAAQQAFATALDQYWRLNGCLEGGPPPCAGDECGGFSDAVYAVWMTCLEPAIATDDCFGAVLCMGLDIGGLMAESCMGGGAGDGGAEGGDGG
jgi:hypothetical protein